MVGYGSDYSAQAAPVAFELELTVNAGGTATDHDSKTVVTNSQAPPHALPCDDGKDAGNGGLLDLRLDRDGSTSGRLFVPGGDEDGADFDVDLVGTWTLAESIVTLMHTADTFLRDTPLVVDGNRLSGQATFGETTVMVELREE